jgi:hypothetical protein
MSIPMHLQNTTLRPYHKRSRCIDYEFSSKVRVF